MSYENQIERLVRERADMVEEKQQNALSATPTTDAERPDSAGSNGKLVKINHKLKRALQTIKEKMQRVAADRPDLFVNIGEETTERLDHLIDTVDNQTGQINLLQSALHDSEGRLQNVVQQLQASFDLYRQQFEADPTVALPSAAPAVVCKIEAEPSERTHEVRSKQASNDEPWKEWSTEPIHCTDERIQYRHMDVQCELLGERFAVGHDMSDPMEQRPASVTSRLFGVLRNMATSLTEEPWSNDWDDQSSPIHRLTDERLALQSNSPTESLIQAIANEIHRIVLENPHLFPQSTGDPLEDLNQLILIIRNFQKEINELQR